MKQKIIFTTIIALALSSQFVAAGSITDTYTTGDTLTATKMDNIKSAVNDNNSNTSTNTTNISNNTSSADANAVNVALIQLQLTNLLPQTSPVGPLINVPAVSVESGGWEICYSEPYDGSDTATITSVLSTCSRDNLMLACRKIGSSIFVLAAQAPRADVTFDTGNDSATTHNANGTEWYFNTDRSWGFALGGDTVTKSSCDTASTNPEYRMCIHTNTDQMTSGYRCGTNLLNGNANWERVILHKD